VAQGKLGSSGLGDFDPFHLLIAEPGMAALSSWDGEHLTERRLPAGLHIVVNSGLGDSPPADSPPAGRAEELARIAHFEPRLRRAVRPDPRPGRPVAQAWGAWLPLLNGDGIGAEDPRALIVRRDLGAGRIWGTTSISLVALSPDGVRYDFTGTPGDRAAWYPVPVGPPE
jgi:hypothetical protein